MWKISLGCSTVVCKFSHIHISHGVPFFFFSFLPQILQVPPGNNQVEVGCLLRSHQTIEEVRQSDAETIRQWSCSRRSNPLRKITSDHVHQTAKYNSCASYAGMSDPIQTAPNPLSNLSPSDPSYGGVGKKIGRKRACSPSLGARLTDSVKRSEKQNVNSLSSPMPDNPETRCASLFASRKVKDSCHAFSSSVRCPFVPEARKLQLSIKKCSVPKLKKSRLHLIAVDRGEGARELQPEVDKKRHSGNGSRNHEQKKGRQKLDGINNFFESEAEPIAEIGQGRTARARCVSQREETIGLQFASHFYGSGRNDSSGSGNVGRTSKFAGLEPAPTEDVEAHEARPGLLGVQALLGPTETCSSADEDMFCATDVIKPKGVDCSKGQHISFECEVDPIPIPGPPGSFLPSPGEEDMDSEGDVLGSSSSLTGSLLHSPPDFHRSGADRDSSDSPVSAISAVSADLKYSHPGLPIGEVPHVVQDNHCWSSFSDGDRVKPTADNATTVAQTASVLVERTISDEKSSKKGEALDTIFEDNNHQSFHQARSEGASVGGSIYEREMFYFSSCPSLVPYRTISASTSASNNNPVLRLMGKNLMVVNKDGDESLQIRDEHLSIPNNRSRPQLHLFNKDCRSFHHEVPSQSRGCEILEQFDTWPQSDRPQVGPSNAASPPSQIRDENSAENQPVIIIDNETAYEGTRRVFTIPTALGNYNTRLHYNASSIYYPSQNASTHTASFRSPPSGVLQVPRNTSMASSPATSSHLRSASYYSPRLS